MTVVERGGGPKVQAGTGPVSVLLDGAWQPQASDWLVIVHGNDYYTLAAMGAPLVGGSSSGVQEITGPGLPADGGTSLAHVRAWKKKIITGGVDLLVAAVESGLADEDKMIAVHVLSGADAADCIDVAAGAFRSDFVPIAQRVAPSLTPSTAAYELVHTNDGGGASSFPYGMPAGMAGQYAETTGGMGYAGAAVQLLAPGPTGTRIFTVSTTAAGYAAVSIAIKPLTVVPTGNAAAFEIGPGPDLWRIEASGQLPDAGPSGPDRWDIAAE
jgi:hypothetical protein